LLDYSYICFNEEKNIDSPINYNLISNDFTKLLKNNESTLNNYINRIRDKSYNKIPVRQKEFVQYQIHLMLKELDNDLILSIIYGRLLRIITNFNRLNTENNFTNISTDIGRDLINNYYYCLYRKYMLLYIDILINNVELLVDNSNIDNSIIFDLKKMKQYRKKSNSSDFIYYSKILSKKIVNYSLDNNIPINLVEYRVFDYTLSN